MGEILVEIMARSAATFGEPGSLAGPYASGAPAIFIDQVARLGHPAGIIAASATMSSACSHRTLKRDGVDVSAIHVIKEATTGSAFVTYRKEGERDFIFTSPTARRPS